MPADACGPPSQGEFTPTEAAIQNGRLARQLIEAAPDAMVIVNQAGTIVLVNQQSEQMFGYSRNELLGEPVEKLIPERFRDRHIAHRADYAAHPHVRRMGERMELFARRRDGIEFPVEIMLSPLRFGEHLLVSAAIRDVTERKLAEAELHSQRLMMLRLLDVRTKELAETSAQLHAAESMAVVGTVAAGLVHDLNNILFPVRSHIELLGQHEAGDEAAEHIQVLQRATGYLQELCKRLRMLTACGGDPHTREAPTDLHEWWRDVAPLLATVLPRHVELRAELPGGLPRVALPRTQLTQAVFNLAHNAGRAMRSQPSGSLTIRANAVRPQRKVRLVVADNGPGMSPEVQRHCLEVSFSSQMKETGHGVGLALVNSIIKRASGAVEIESEQGRGTTFTLVLPTEEMERKPLLPEKHS
jgi:PAS domain S-box-containing protein